MIEKDRFARFGHLNSLPAGLVEYLYGNIVLFLGCDIHSRYFSGKTPPSRRELAQKLSIPLGNIEKTESLEQVAENFELEFGRQQLIQKTVALLSDVRYEPQDFHRQIVKLPLEAVITTSQDEILEKAFRDAGRKWTTILNPVNLPFVELPERVNGLTHPMIIKVRGTISQPDSLVLTREDDFYVKKRLGKLFDIVRYLFVLRPLIVIGHNPRESDLRILYTEATDGIVKYQRRAFMIWPKASSLDKKYWLKKNVQMLDSDPVEVLREANLVKQTLQHDDALIEKSYSVLQKDPYKFLAHFGPEDADIFFGRDTESKILFQFILSRKIVILFGESGVGKTSLLSAGIIPKLQNEDYKIAYTRVYESPVASLRSKVLEALNRPSNLLNKSTSELASLLRHVFKQDDKLVIMLDQFEEIFLYLNAIQREDFYLELEQLIQQSKYEIRIVLIIRQDFFPLLFEGMTITKYLQGNTYRLASFNHDNAYLALTQPASRVGMQFEEKLAEILLSEDGLLDKLSGKISPASLQIVCDRLYQEALLQNRGERIGARMTVANYRRLGGVEVILKEYMEFVLSKLPEEEVPVAREILKVMVTSQQTKKAVTTKQLESILKASPLLKIGPKHFDYNVLVNSLVDQRLIRAFEKDKEVVYELMHDHIAKLVSSWMSELEVRTKVVYDLLKRELESWQQFGTSRLIEKPTLLIINECRDELWHLGSGELKLICLSSLATNFECDYWVQRAQEADVLFDIERVLISNVLEFSKPGDAILQLSRINTSSLSKRLIEMSKNEFQDTVAENKSSIYEIKTKQHKRICSVLIKMTNPIAVEYLRQLAPPGLILIPAGRFEMGSTQYPGEGPVHSVWLDSYYIRKYPVTNSEYAEFINAGGYESPKYWTKSGWEWLQQADRKHPDGWQDQNYKLSHPVVGINWFEAYAFTIWISANLPSEAEWEKAASYNPETKQKYCYPWGNEFDKSRCNTNATALDNTTPVDNYSPSGDSPLGVADMAGNVWEWCNSIFSPYPYSKDDGREETETTGILRVKRGGSYKFNPILARSTARLDDGPSRCGLDQGMRYAVKLDLEKNGLLT